MFNSIRYLLATLRVYYLEAQLVERKLTAPIVQNPELVEEMSAALAKARADWIAFYPAGVRFTWEIA